MIAAPALDLGVRSDRLDAEPRARLSASPCRPVGRLRAFTLLEILLAMVLAGAVIVSTLSFYDFVLQTRSDVLEASEELHAQRLVMDRMASELTAALAYPFLNLGMTGSNERIGFPTTRVPGPAAWVDRGLTDRPVPPEHDLSIVGYRLAWSDDDEAGGEPRIIGLERLEQTLATAMDPEEGDEIRARLMTRHVRFVFFEYFLDGNWLDSWEGGDLPAAVRVTIGGPPLPEGVEPENYPWPVFQRVVFIPAGAAPGGGGGRGVIGPGGGGGGGGAGGPAGGPQ